MDSVQSRTQALNISRNSGSNMRGRGGGRWLSPLVVLLALLVSRPNVAPVAASPATTSSWTLTGTMTESRPMARAVLLPTGQVLVISSCCQSRTAELYDLRTGTWTSTGSMLTAHDGGTLTLLPTGKVLVAGGYQPGGGFLTRAELYDPRTGTWNETGNMHDGRADHTATLLPNGMVLVAGGAGDNEVAALSSSELYHPGTGMWTLTGSMHDERKGHAATLLPDGTVLVSGGCFDGCGEFRRRSSAEIYDPRNGAWTLTGSMSTVRVGHTATLLPNGLVLVAGGCCPDYSNESFATAELYDPHTRTWGQTGSMQQGRSGHTATLLPNGQVLVAGGAAAGTVAELYDPSTYGWTSTASMHVGRTNAAAVLLPTGTVLVAGGDAASAEVYNPTGIPLFTDGFESGSFSAWSSVKTNAGGSAVVESYLVQSGHYAARLSATPDAGSYAYARKTLAAPQTELTVSGDFNVRAQCAAGSTVPLFRLFDGSGNLLVSLYRLNLTNGQLWVQASGAYRRSTGMLPLKAWGHLDLHVVTAGDNRSTVEVRLNGALVYQNRGLSLGSDGVQTVQIGNEAHQQVFDLVADTIAVQ
jgi:WD40 repeat protein